jgi:hypothetical protein
MPGGGTMTIRTANLTVDHLQSREPNLEAGRYVLPSVGDGDRHRIRRQRSHF